MPKRIQRSVVVILTLLLTLSSAIVTSAYHEDDTTIHQFADVRFENRWARTDLPVAAGVAVRTWVWGPSPYTEGRMEPYLDAPGGERLVQYFDKSRMELLDPSVEDTSIWTVTQGLLALEMLDGKIQIGDNAFAQHSEGPSQENVAGDPGPDNGPTYATMAGLMDEDARAEGTVIADWLSLDGTVTHDASLEDYGVTAAYHIQQDWIDHTIASVFWEFMESSGTIWDGDYLEGDLFKDPFYAVGYPVTEAYWTNVNVDGDPMDVLVQCFERRCLTYAPENPEGWKVEAGNVGQHYYRWRETHVGELVPEFGADVIAEGLVQPRGATYTDDGVYVAEAGSGGDECVTIEEEEEPFEVCLGLTGAVTLVDDEGQSRVVEGLPSLAVGEDGSGPHDVAFDDEGNMYVIIGMGAPPEARDLFSDDRALLASIVKVEENGDFTVVADLAEYEADNNPDDGNLDTNPYSIAFDGEDLIATDAGGNSLLRVGLDGSIETIAVFPSREVPAPPFLGMPEDATIPMESVPTNVVIGPDGNYYVTELTGFPFPVGGANVYQVTPEGVVEVHAEGFTNAIDLAFDSKGRLYVLEIAAGSLLGIDEEAIGEGDLSSAASRIVRIDADGTQTVVNVPDLFVATGLTIGADDELYVVNMSLTPGAQLVRVDI